MLADAGVETAPRWQRDGSGPRCFTAWLNSSQEPFMFLFTARLIVLSHHTWTSRVLTSTGGCWCWPDITLPWSAASLFKIMILFWLLVLGLVFSCNLSGELKTSISPPGGQIWCQKMFFWENQINEKEPEFKARTFSGVLIKEPKFI